MTKTITMPAKTDDEIRRSMRTMFGESSVTNADSIYQHLCALAGMYGKAFFGHAKTRRERDALTALWRRAFSIAHPESASPARAEAGR